MIFMIFINLKFGEFFEYQKITSIRKITMIEHLYLYL